MSRARDLAAFVSNADGDIKFDTDTLFIDSSANKVGIGTNTPEEKLHLENESAVTAIKLDGTGDGAAQISSSYGILNLDADIDDENSASYIRLQTSGNERVRINNDGEVGINTNDPTALLHIKSASTANSTQFKIESTDTGSASGPDMYLYRNSSSPADSDVLGAIWFAGNNSANEEILYGSILSQALDVTDATEDSAIYFNVLDGGGAQAERLRIDGDGIKFNGDTAAANALDDYERGTFTVSLESVSGITGTLNTQDCEYIVVGELVHILGQITFNNTLSETWSSGDYIYLSGLPFTYSSIGSNSSLVGNIGNCHIYSSLGSNVQAIGGVHASGTNSRMYLSFPTVVGNPPATVEIYFHATYHRA